MAEPVRFVVERRRSLPLVRWLVVPTMVIVLGLAFYWLLGAPRMDALTRIGFLFVVGLLFLAVSGGFVWDLVEGNRPALEVNSTGIRVMGAPWLNWSQVAEVRAEEAVSFASAETESGWEIGIGGFTMPLGRGRTISLEEALASGVVTVSHRLGIVPRDPTLGRSGGLLGGVSRAAERERHKTAERMGRRAIDLAPIGIYERHMLAEFDDVVAGVRGFHPVVELSDLKPDEA